MGNYRNFKLVYYFVAQATARADRERLEKDLRFFEKYLKADKVYLEPYRSGVMADEDHVEMCREVFEKHGVEVAGGLTTTIDTPEGDEPKQRMFDTLCYNDEKMLKRLRDVCTFLGEHFNEFIIDDFFFTNCTCDACRAGRDAWNRENGVTDGSWKGYRLSLLEKVSREDILGPAKAANPACRVTIKYPNWAESYQETGYNPAQQRKLFDRIYTGTETRDTVTTDQHLPRYLSYSLMTYFEQMWPGHNGGGWFDPFDFHLTEQYLEQAYLTAFSKPKEIMLFCFQALADNASVPPLGYQLEKLDEVLDHCGNPAGIQCYLPDNCQGEDNIQDFLGMCGLPVMLTPYWPEQAEAILLTRSSAYDPEVVEKLDRYVAAGGKALVTSGFLEATMDRGIQLHPLYRTADPGQELPRGNRRRKARPGIPPGDGRDRHSGMRVPEQQRLGAGKGGGGRREFRCSAPGHLRQRPDVYPGGAGQFPGPVQASRKSPDPYPQRVPGGPGIPGMQGRNQPLPL